MSASETVLLKMLNGYLIYLCIVLTVFVVYAIYSQVCKFMGWKYWGS